MSRCRWLRGSSWCSLRCRWRTGRCRSGMRNMVERGFGRADLKVGQYIWRGVAGFLVGAIFVVAGVWGQVAQNAKAKDAPIAVQFTDIRKAAGITFLQDSTATEE